jgi:hypothetical protein
MSASRKMWYVGSLRDMNVRLGRIVKSLASLWARRWGARAWISMSSFLEMRNEGECSSHI